MGVASWMPRGEFFAGLFALACINGLASRAIQAANALGWESALLGTFEVSALVWIACGSGIALVFQDRQDSIAVSDLVIGLIVVVLIALPIGGLSWLAVTILSIYVIYGASPQSARRRGAVILLATSVPMLWSRLLFQYFAKFILEIDSALVGWLLGTQRAGNVVRFADNSGSLVIAPYCSSLANVSLAFLTWVMISQWKSRSWSTQDLYWCFAAAAAVVAINVTRISLMGLSQDYYRAIHSFWGNTITNALILACSVGICLLGMRREAFARA